jgi:hypothetical protein
MAWRRFSDSATGPFPLFGHTGQFAPSEKKKKTIQELNSVQQQSLLF